MVSTEVLPLAPGVTELGANEQLRVCGSPEQVSATDLVKEPEFGLIVTLTMPLAPEERVSAEGLAIRFNVGSEGVLGLLGCWGVPGGLGMLGGVAVLTAQLRVNATAPDIWFVMLGFPTACTYEM